MPLSDLEAIRLRANEYADQSLPTVKVVLIIVCLLVICGALAYNLLWPTGPDVESLPRVDQAAADQSVAGRSAGQAGSAEQSGKTIGSGASAPGETSDEVVVQVAGAVKQPGVFKVPAMSRVNDAVERAGGLTAEADSARVNLAAKLSDGQQVVVPKVGEPQPPGAVAGVGGANGSTGPAGQTSISINSASASELEELPGVGPATAKAIIDHRNKNGPFRSVEQLGDVKGIGDAKLAQIAPKATL